MTRGPTVPYIDLASEYRELQPEIDRVVLQVLASGRYVLGPNVEAFEREIAEFCRARWAVGVGSGTDALEFALRAAGIGPGDEVLTTPMTYVATVEAICAIGARPIFADIDPVSYALSASHAAERLTPGTRAILPVHLYGQPAPMTALTSLAASRRLVVIEDCAQAIGATCDDRLVGTWGVAGAFSFFPTKNLGACGDGGMVITDDDALAHRVKLLRMHGSVVRDEHLLVGRTGRLDELQAAILRVKLRHLSVWTEARRRVARHYTKLFTARVIPHVPELRLPRETPGTVHVYHLYALWAPQRDALKTALQEQGIEALVHYSRPAHLQPAFREFGYRAGEFPEAEALARHELTLPLYPTMTLDAVERVVDAVAAFYAGHRHEDL